MLLSSLCFKFSDVSDVHTCWYMLHKSACPRAMFPPLCSSAFGGPTHTHGAPETPARAVRNTWHALLCWNANKCFSHCNFSICCHFNDTHPFISIPATISMLRVIKRIFSQKEKYTHWKTLKIILPDMNYLESLLIFQFSVCIIAEKYRCARWSLLCIRNYRILPSNISGVHTSFWNCWERVYTRKAFPAPLNKC